MSSEAVVTYTVRDKSGAIRTRGATEEQARALAHRLAFEADVPTACEVERVTYRATVVREVVAKFAPGGSAEGVAAPTPRPALG